MAKVFASVGEAFGYANKNTFKKPVLWVLVTVVAFLEAIALFVGLFYLLTPVLLPLVGLTIADVTGGLTNINLGALAALIPNEVGGFIAIGIIGIIIAFVLGLFFSGLEIRILGGKDVTFAGFFGTVGVGLQSFVISLIYAIIIGIVMGIVSFIFFGLGNALPALTIIGTILLVLLSLFFTIFLIPAFVNFAQQGKFGAAFHFKEIREMIGQAKWYKILAGIIVISLIVVILALILGFIAGLILQIPMPAGAILAFIFLSLTGVYLFFLEASFWAKLFAKAE